jgi:hypothetical protein
MWRIRFLMRVLRPAVLRIWWRELDHVRLASSGDLSLRVIDLRSGPDRNPDLVVAQVSAALGLISAAGQGFGELVVDHLQQVIIAPGIHLISVKPPVYWGSSAWLESEEAHYLASQLIWVATSIRLHRNARHAKRRADPEGVAQACWDAQERFLRSFPDGNWWIQRIRPKGSAA